MRIIAVDPGKITGFASWRDDTETHFHAWSQDYIPALDLVMGEVTHQLWDAVVVEDFVISMRTLKTATDGWPRGAELEFIGAVKWACRTHEVALKMQTAARAKSFSVDAKLKRIGWWSTGLDHPRDAARHLMLYMVAHDLLDPRSLVGDQ